MPRPILATVHPAALQHSLARARRAAPDALAWAVVKANAYGHGIERVFDALRSADGFALLDLADHRDRPCEAVDEIAKGHLAEVERKIADLTALRGELKSMIRQCGHGAVRDCRIIEALSPGV